MTVGSVSSLSRGTSQTIHICWAYCKPFARKKEGENAKKMKVKQQDKLAAKKKLNNDLIDIYRDWYLKSEPFSDVWVECYNKLQYQLYLHDYYDEEG